jgi:cyclase
MTRQAQLRLVGFVLGCLLLPVANAQFGDKPAKLSLIKLSNDMYVIHNDYVPGNTTVLVTDAGVLLVDDKFEIDHDNIMSMLRTITDKPVKYVINTHHHADHTGGNAKLQMDGTLAVSSDEARARMVAGKMAGLPDISIGHRGTLYFGGKTVEMYWFGRAHTDGDIVVLFPDERILAAGDIYTNDPGTPELIDYAGGGSAKDWTGTMGGALKLDFDTVVPGHGVPAKKADMAKYRDTSKRLTELISQMVKQGKSKADVEKTMRSEFGWQDFHVNMALDALIKEMGQ